jgi:hypothetical protein
MQGNDEVEAARRAPGPEQRENAKMTLNAHLAELERRHHALDAEIEEAMKHNSVDDAEIVELKRKKLHLKDEIERLKHG